MPAKFAQTMCHHRRHVIFMVVAVGSFSLVVGGVFSRTMSNEDGTGRLRAQSWEMIPWGGLVRPHSATASATHPPRGLAELVGDRPPLSRHMPAQTDSASWIPAAPWYATRNVTALFPSCPLADMPACDTLWAEPTTAAVQAALWASQNPDDCEAARYLVLDHPWHSGLGSSLFIHMYMLGLAIRYV